MKGGICQELQPQQSRKPASVWRPRRVFVSTNHISVSIVNLQDYGSSVLLARPRCPEPLKGAFEMTNSDRHVVPNPEGGWDVEKPGASRSSSHQDTQAGAIDRAREIVHNLGGGEVVIHGRDGRIRDKDTIAPGNDPFPPRDSRH